MFCPAYPAFGLSASLETGTVCWFRILFLADVFSTRAEYYLLCLSQTMALYPVCDLR